MQINITYNMKIEKFNKVNEKKTTGKNEYYVVRQCLESDDEYDYVVIPAFVDEYEQNYDEHDLNDVIEFVIDSEEEYEPDELKIYKITEEEVSHPKYKAYKNSRKYNI